MCLNFFYTCFSLLPSQTLLGGPDLSEASGKRQYDRDFLLGFQFMPACIQKPEGLPPISDVVLDKVNKPLVAEKPACTLIKKKCFIVFKALRQL